MLGLAQLPLDGGGIILLEEVSGAAELGGPDPDGSGSGGPVKAGRVGDAARELPRTLQEALVPIRELTQAVRDQLRGTGPRTVEVEFSVNLSAKAGVVITASEASAHLKVRMVWEKEERPVQGDGA